VEQDYAILLRVPTSTSANPLERVSTVEAIANLLRSQILSGVVGAGETIPEEQTAADLGVSRHSLRAAMRRLVDEGLLRHEPHRGVRVPVLAREDVHDVYRMRRLLELEATRLVASSAVVPGEALAAVETFEALADDAGWDEVVEQDLRFHRAIIEAADSPRLARAYTATHTEVSYCLALLRPHYDHPADVAAEHRELLEPIAAGDPDTACQLLLAHLIDAEHNLLGAMSERPEGPLEEHTADSTDVIPAQGT
jgi:DNA-binding GntR family transcriptional regulator